MSNYILSNGNVYSENELMHYGVVGMKWGHRKYKREAKAERRMAEKKAFDEYDKEINKIEAPYKRGQNLSKKDMAREATAEAKYSKAMALAKMNYKQALNNPEYKAAKRAGRARAAKNIATAGAITLAAAPGVFVGYKLIKLQLGIGSLLS